MDVLVNVWGKLNVENELEYLKILGIYINVKKSEVNQDFFFILVLFVSRFMEVVVIYGKYCCRKFEVKKVIKRGYVVFLKFRCIRIDWVKYVYLWVLLLYFFNGKYLINECINYVFVCSGMLFFYYFCFCKVVGFGVFFVFNCNFFFYKYKLFVQEEYDEFISIVFLEEVGMYDELDGIDIIMDVCYGWRKNVKDISVVVIGD